MIKFFDVKASGVSVKMKRIERSAFLPCSNTSANVESSFRRFL